MEPVERITVDREVLSCDGGGGALGHPRVYLNMEGRGEIDCPYCGCRFVLTAAAEQAADDPSALPKKASASKPGGLEAER